MNLVSCLDKASAMAFSINLDLYQARQHGVPERALDQLLNLQAAIEDVRNELAREMFGDNEERIAAELEASTDRTASMIVYSTTVH